MIISRQKLICISNSLLNLSIWPAFTCMREHGWVGSHRSDQKIIIYLDRGLDHRAFFVPRTDAHPVDWQTRSLENGTDVIAENQDSNYLRNRHWENTKCHGISFCSVMPVSNPPEKGKQYEAIKAPEPGNSTLEVEASHLIVCKHTMPSSKDGEERYVTLQRLSDSQLQLEVYR